MERSWVICSRVQVSRVMDLLLVVRRCGQDMGGWDEGGDSYSGTSDDKPART